MTHELRNTHEARDDLPTSRDQFLHPRAVADLIDHALPDLRRARDLVQYVPHNQRLARVIAEAEEMVMLLRTERHY
jgi:hypothetical protein